MKSMLGHTMGAASAIEAIACALLSKMKLFPPQSTMRLLILNAILTAYRINKTGNINIAINNSYAFGGNNACLVLYKFCETEEESSRMVKMVQKAIHRLSQTFRGSMKRK